MSVLEVVAWTVDLRLSPLGLLAVMAAGMLGAVELDRRVWRGKVEA